MLGLYFRTLLGDLPDDRSRQQFLIVAERDHVLLIYRMQQAAAARDRRLAVEASAGVEHVAFRQRLRQAFDAIAERDYPVVQGTVFVIAVTYVIVNIAVDVLYGVIDPRIRVS